MKSIIISTVLLSSMAFSQDVTERITQTFNESFQNKDLKCYYYQPKVKALISPVSNTLYSNKSLSRNFKLDHLKDSLDLSFKLYLQGSQAKYQVVFNQNLKYEGNIDKRNFYKLMEFGDGGFFVSNLTYLSGDQSLAQKYDLGKVKCNLELAKSKAIALKSEQHINVHPHSRYDYLSLLTKPVAEYFEKMQSYVLIDAANRQGAYVNYNNFLSTGSYTTAYEVFDTRMSIPSNIPMLISPAGYNDFTFESDEEVNIYFTGGNHNYCIWNNTRNIFWGLFYSDKAPVLNINYDTKAMVVQRSGIIPGTSFKKRHVRGSNVLGDIFKNNPGVSEGYHRAYNYYFQKDFFLRFTGVFKTLTYSYEAEGFSVKEVIQGQGDRDLTINLNYL